MGILLKQQDKKENRCNKGVSKHFDKGHVLINIKQATVKKLLTAIMLTAFVSTYAQISLENHYSAGGLSQGYLRLIKLSSSGYKYAINDQTKITLYNLNHSLWKTISFPSLTGGVGSMPQVFYISEELFNTNPADIEYFVIYTDTNMFPIGHSAVIDETGNVLVSKDTTQIQGVSHYGNEDFISYTPVGVKMIIWQENTKGAWVYSLPGTLPCHDCTNGTTTGIMTGNNGTNTERLMSYPNPTSGLTTIEYVLPQGSVVAELVFYTLTGQEVKRFKVTNAFHNILISTADLDAGTYYYQLQTADGFKATKKMAVLK